MTIEESYAAADRINDQLGITNPLIREYNRVSWAVQDLQDADEPREAWGPLLDMEYDLGRQLTRRG